MRDDFGRQIDLESVRTVGATMVLLDALSSPESPFTVLSDFHPSFGTSITLVHSESESAITLVIVESSDSDD
jgi:hypothetical protein